MNFGEALQLCKGGAAVARSGWNGKGMFIFYVPGSTIEVSADRPLGIAVPALVGKKVEYRPHIDMKTAQGDIVPWVASQTDTLATDWVVVK